MPNWCQNTLTITAPDTPEGLRQMEVFRTRLQAGMTKDDRGRLCLNMLQTFVPMPQKYEGTVDGTPGVHKTADDGRTWYDWQLDHWGVKWGDCGGEIVVDGGDFLDVAFRTPWGHPDKALLAISRQFPELCFSDDWDEETPSKGYFTVCNGEILAEATITRGGT